MPGSTADYLQDLITRMGTAEQTADSRDSVSWKAYREAETIDDPALLPSLEAIIAAHPKPRERQIRCDAYFVYGKILKNHFTEEGCAYLISRLRLEKNKYALYPLLDRLRDLPIPAEMDIAPVLQCARHEQWTVRHSAIRALGACPTEESREALRWYLCQEDEKAYRQEIIYAQASLGRIGTPEDIPLIEPRLRSRSRDVKLSAEIAIERIRARAAGEPDPWEPSR